MWSVRKSFLESPQGVNSWPLPYLTIRIRQWVSLSLVPQVHVLLLDVNLG